MLKALAPGDVVTVTRIDRLARSTFDLFGIASSASWTQRRSSDHWRSRGPTPARAPGG
jgi:DNA invertase Pin-like site-specific DNA recombinase